MKIAHLIMAHKNPAQIERLIRAMAHEDFDFYIHLDIKADMQEFKHLASLPNVQFTPRRFSVRWASYRFTSAILECTRDVLATGTTYDFINLLSGQDYPIKPVATIYDFFARHQGYSFLSFEDEDSPWWSHAKTRVEQYHTTYFKFKGQYFLQRLANRLLPRRTFPLPYDLYGSSDSSWWTITGVCADYLVRFMDAHSGLRFFSMFTWGSDEFLIATILMNSPYKDSIVNENYRYIDWSAGGPNPKILTAQDYNKLTQAHKLFARKFDIVEDQAILDLIDERLIGVGQPKVAARH
jgi:hypothetical protein